MAISRTNMRNQINKSGKKKRTITKERRGDLTVIRVRYGDYWNNYIQFRFN